MCNSMLRANWRPLWAVVGVILAATALAIILFKWVQSSGGTSIISTILGKVVGWVAGQF